MKMNAALAALLLPVASVAWSQVDADLARSEEKAQQIVRAAKQSVRKIAVPAEDNVMTPPTETSSALVSVSELLKGASSEAKLEFLENLKLVDGKVASIGVELLKRDLGEARVKEIILALNPSKEKAYKLAGSVGTLGLCNDRTCKDTACYSDKPGVKYCVDTPKSECYASCK